jgi:TorA maturation chaperone TorD
MNGDAVHVAMPHPISAEDRVRADLYALVAALFAAAPDREFLAALAAAPELPDDPDSPLVAPYNALLRASRAMDPDAAEQEYTDLFIGVGKCEVNLHASHWMSGFMMDKPLASLRADLGGLGLERRDATTMLEDHLAAVAETMRLLVAGGGGRPPVPLAVQRQFFDAWIASWAPDCCAAIDASALANYYLRASELTRVFLAIERDSFAMG